MNKEEHLFEYQSELNPDKNYFIQLSHYLSRGSNYYSEETFNEYVKRNSINDNDFSIIHSDVRCIPLNLTGFLCYFSNIDHNFAAIGFTETWLSPSKFTVWNRWIPSCWFNTTVWRRGVSLLICDMFMYTEVSIVQDYIECVFVKICHMSRTFIDGSGL